MTVRTWYRFFGFGNLWRLRFRRALISRRQAPQTTAFQLIIHNRYAQGAWPLNFHGLGASISTKLKHKSDGELRELQLRLLSRTELKAEYRGWLRAVPFPARRAAGGVGARAWHSACALSRCRSRPTSGFRLRRLDSAVIICNCRGI